MHPGNTFQIGQKFRNSKMIDFHWHILPQVQTRKGVTILISKQTPFQLIDSIYDPLGRYIFLKGKIGPHPIVIPNIYAPNMKQVAFFRQIGDLLTSFSTGILILGGDFNVLLNPILDTSNGMSSLPFRAIK